MLFRPEGFISIDEAVIEVKQKQQREEERKQEAREYRFRQQHNLPLKGVITPEQIETLPQETQDGLFLLKKERDTTEFYRPKFYHFYWQLAAEELKEALASQKLHACAILENGQPVQVPPDVWIGSNGNQPFITAQVAIVISGYEVRLRCWVHAADFRDYLRGKECRPRYQFADVRQVNSSVTTRERETAQEASTNH